MSPKGAGNARRGTDQPQSARRWGRGMGGGSCAGTTGGTCSYVRCRRPVRPTLLDTGLRRYDGWGAGTGRGGFQTGCEEPLLAPPWVPAFAGTTTRDVFYTYDAGGPSAPLLWIPAFAGMTGGVLARGGAGPQTGCEEPLLAPPWVPAFAGTTGGAGDIQDARAYHEDGYRRNGSTLLLLPH